MILEAGEAGISVAELHREIYARHSRPRRTDAAFQVIRAVNVRLQSTPWRIVPRPRRFCRWRLEQVTRPVERKAMLTFDRSIEGSRADGTEDSLRRL